MRKVFIFVLILSLSVSLFAASSDSLNLEEQVSASNASYSKNETMVAVTSEDYLVTAGDVYTLGYIAGSSAVSYKIVVDPTYKIRVSNLGVVDAKGMKFLDLKQKVEEIVSTNYPMSGVQLVITTPGVFKITIKGEVEKTVFRNVSGLVRLSDIVDEYGTSYSSKRFFTIENSDGTVNNYDLFLAQRFGDLENDPYLRPDDTVIYTKYDRIVSVQGLVRRPGQYELLKSENLKTLIEYYCDGFDPLADTDEIVLTRKLSEISNSGDKTYINSSDVDKDLIVKNLDVITVKSKTALKNTIFVTGAVSISTQETLQADTTTKSIKYEFTEGERYCDFIRTNTAWFGETSDYERAYVKRDNENISIDLYSMLYDPSYESDMVLEANDILVVPFKQFFVSVTGAVINPGRYAYVPDRTYDYYIGLAGGFNDDQNTGGKIKITNIDGEKVDKSNFIEPESTIRASKNSFVYNFNKFAVPVSTALTIVTSAFLTLNYVQNLK